MQMQAPRFEQSLWKRSRKGICCRALLEGGASRLPVAGLLPLGRVLGALLLCPFGRFIWKCNGVYRGCEPGSGAGACPLAACSHHGSPPFLLTAALPWPACMLTSQEQPICLQPDASLGCLAIEHMRIASMGSWLLVITMGSTPVGLRSALACKHAHISGTAHLLAGSLATH